MYYISTNIVYIATSNCYSSASPRGLTGRCRATWVLVKNLAGLFFSVGSEGGVLVLLENSQTTL